MVRTYNTYERASLPNTSSRHGLTYSRSPKDYCLGQLVSPTSPGRAVLDGICRTKIQVVDDNPRQIAGYCRLVR